MDQSDANREHVGEDATERVTRAPGPADPSTEEAVQSNNMSGMDLGSTMPAPGAIVLPGVPVLPPMRHSPLHVDDIEEIERHTQLDADRRDTDEMPRVPDTGGLDDTGGMPETEDGPGPRGGVPDAVLEPDDQIGSYRIIQWLGTGGIGEVYEAEHLLIGRRVALKVLRADARENEDTVQRFFDEARVVNRVRHRNIVDVTDLVLSPGEPPFIVMELLAGFDLTSRLPDTPLAPAVVVRIGVQVASALAALHAAGIAHRDLKPANIYLLGDPDDPEVRIIDFGVAKVLERDETINHVETRHGQILGTLDYLSPEQAIGDAADTSADVFALGVVLHELSTGERPFVAGSLAELLLDFSSRKVTAAKVRPRALRSLVLACLAVDRDERPTMTDVRDALARM